MSQFLADLLVWLLAGFLLWFAHEQYMQGDFFWAAMIAAAGIETCARNATR